MVATAFLSMWISNTATSVMMLPIGIVIINQLQYNPNFSSGEHNTFSKALMLFIAYSASIGGVSTLIGTPTSMVMAGAISQICDYEISFLDWVYFCFSTFNNDPHFLLVLLDQNGLFFQKNKLSRR